MPIFLYFRIRRHHWRRSVAFLFKSFQDLWILKLYNSASPHVVFQRESFSLPNGFAVLPNLAAMICVFPWEWNGLLSFFSFFCPICRVILVWSCYFIMACLSYVIQGLLMVGIFFVSKNICQMCCIEFNVITSKLTCWVADNVSVSSKLAKLLWFSFPFGPQKKRIA